MGTRARQCGRECCTHATGEQRSSVNGEFNSRTGSTAWDGSLSAVAGTGWQLWRVSMAVPTQRRFGGPDTTDQIRVSDHL
jgi:hypothetical protein